MLGRILSTLAVAFQVPSGFFHRNGVNIFIELVSHSQGSKEMLLGRMEETQEFHRIHLDYKYRVKSLPLGFLMAYCWKTHRRDKNGNNR